MALLNEASSGLGQLGNVEFLPVVLHEEFLECHEDFQMVGAFGPAEEFPEYPENFRVVGVLGLVEEFRAAGEFWVGRAEGDFAEQNPSVSATGINGDG